MHTHVHHENEMNRFLRKRDGISTENEFTQSSLRQCYRVSTAFNNQILGVDLIPSFTFSYIFILYTGVLPTHISVYHVYALAIEDRGQS